MRNSYLLFLAFPLAVGAQWEKHVIVESSGMINSAVAADWNGDGRLDVIASLDDKVILFEGPEWGAHTLHAVGRRQEASRLATNRLSSENMGVSH